MGWNWFFWCSFLLGALTAWLLSWLLDWLLGRGGEHYQAQLSEAQNDLGLLQAELNIARAAQIKLISTERELLELGKDFESLKANLSTQGKDLEAAGLKIQGLEASLKDAESTKNQLSNLQGRFNTVQAERDRFSNELEALRTKLGNMGKLQADFSSLQTRFAALEAERSKLAGELDGKSSVDSLRAELGELQAKYDQLLGERNGLSGELTGLKARLSELEGVSVERGQLLAEIERYKNEFSSLQSRLGGLESERNRLDLDITSSRSETVLLQRRIEALQQDRDEYKSQSVNLSDKLSAISDSSALLQNLQKRFAGTKPEELESHFLALENERNIRMGELEILRKQIEAVAGERDHLRAEAESLLKRLNQLSTDSNNVITERNRLSADVDRLRADLNQSQGAYQDLESLRTSLGDLRTRFQKVEEERNWFAGEVGGLRKELETAVQSKAELEQFRANYTALQARISDYEAQLAKQQQMASNYGVAEVRMADSESELKTIQGSQQDLEQYRANYVALQARVSDLEAELDQAKQKTADYDQLAANFATMQAPIQTLPASAEASAAAKPRKPRQSRSKEVIGYRVTRSRVFRAEPAPQDHDPLGVIEGLGNYWQEVLWKHKIRTFEDLATTSTRRLKEICGKDLEYDEWIVEARRFTRGVYKLSQAITGRTRRKADDLTRIEGIGSKISEALMVAGIRTFVDLEAASEGQLQAAIEAAGIGFAPSIHTWSKQAAYLVGGDEAGFQAYIARLTAGRE